MIPEEVWDLVKGVALAAAGGLAMRFLPERWQWAGLVPIGVGIYFMVKPFFHPTEYEEAQPGEHYETWILEPKPNAELTCGIWPHRFRWAIRNPYDKPKRVYTAICFYKTSEPHKGLMFWRPMGLVDLGPGETWESIYDYVSFPCDEKYLGSWKVLSAVFYKRGDYTTSIGHSEWVPFEVKSWF